MTLLVKNSIIAAFCFLQLILISQTEPSQQFQFKRHADSLLNFAKTQLGVNYCYANASPERGFDCSGFVHYVFNHFNIQVPRSSKLYTNFGTKVPLDSAKKGDVIVFTGTNSKKRSPGHVGIILDNVEGVPSFIHSSSGKKKGVIISDFNESPYYIKRFIKIVRVTSLIE